MAAFRRGPDGRWGTVDDGVFRRRNEAPDFLPENELRRWNALAPFLSVRGSAYRLDFPASAGVPRLRVVVTTDGKDQRVERGAADDDGTTARGEPARRCCAGCGGRWRPPAKGPRGF
ncbi:MAG: hypothetical protein IPH91_00010 [Elusimicrobia bacterium]|nr:hypothetical protein [Elusimicrobiota bacterium]